MRKKRIGLVLAGLLILLTACGKKESENLLTTEAQQTEAERTESEQDEVESVESEQVDMQIVNSSLTVWPTYWDTVTVLKEMEAMQDKIDTVCYFAAYFDDKQQPFIPEETLQTLAAAKAQFASKNWKSYLTFVNDRLLSGGGSSLKDTSLLYDLLQQPVQRKKHIDQILNMTAENGFDGIEIDYEGIKKDTELWNILNIFLNELTAEAANRKISVRILLEPSAPVDSISFPAGPEYVLMCYNLYGYGTAPGPKANKEFLIQMSQLLEKVPEPRNMALSLGGFDFAADGSVSQLTEVECVSLLQATGAAVNRDSGSKDLVFSYIDSKSMKHEVWYADNETLQYWMRIGNSCGIDRFSIWRLGSNVTLQ